MIYVLILLVFIHWFPIRGISSFGIPLQLLTCQHVQLMRIEQKYATWYLKMQGKGTIPCLEKLSQPFSCKIQKSHHICRLSDLDHTN